MLGKSFQAEGTARTKALSHEPNAVSFKDQQNGHGVSGTGGKERVENVVGEKYGFKDFNLEKLGEILEEFT